MFRLLKYIIVILLLPVFILFLIIFIGHFVFASHEIYQGKISNHFDGMKFNNTTLYTKRSLWDALHWSLLRNRQHWPQHLENLPHSPVTPVTENRKVKLTFINHSTALFQTKDINVLTDPIWSERASPFSFLGPKRVRNPGIPFNELPRIDVVLISHNHYDHMDLATLKELNRTFHPVFLVPLGNKSFLKYRGIDNVVELDWWQQYKFHNALFTLLPTQHWSARWLTDRYRTLWGSFGIDIEGKKIYFSGDCGYSNHFNDIRNKWGRPDMALLSIGAYLPEWFMGPHHLNPEQAVKAHLELQAKQSMGIHFNTFQMSDEAIDQPVKDLVNARKKYKLSEEQFFLLPEGRSKEF